jgi:hypothetical protein
MLIQHGQHAETLEGKPWYILELRAEGTVESTLRRLVEELPDIFRRFAAELFIPLKNHDLETFELFTGTYVFVRSNSFKSILRLKTVTGAVGLLTVGDSGRSGHVIPANDEYVQELMQKDEEAFRARSKGIAAGSFVRILGGQPRGFCGTVAKLGKENALVTVELLTKKVLIKSPIKNLLNLDHVPKEQRAFFYGPMLKDLFDQDGDAGDLVAPFLHTPTPIVYTPEELGVHVKAGKAAKTPRSVTVTHYLREEAQAGKTPRQMLDGVVGALARGVLKKPKNLHILFGCLKLEYSAAHKEFKSWYEIRRAPALIIELQDVYVAAESAHLGIPRETPEDQIKPDGRSIKGGRPTEFPAAAIDEAIRQNPDATTKQLCDIVGCGKGTIERHRRAAKHVLG